MAAKHTPGPWAVYGYGLEDGLYIARDEDETACVCQLYWVDREAGNSNVVYENDEANADLIAAAPEMLEQLIVCRSVLRTALSDITDPTGISVIERRIAEISAVIAKAQGATP